MFQDVTKITHPIAAGAGYAMIFLVLAAVIDTALQTNLASLFDKVSIRSTLAFATLYCFVMAVAIATRGRTPSPLERKLDSYAIDRLLAFLGLCIVIGGLPAYTNKTPAPLYFAMALFASIAVSFAAAMWGRSYFIKEKKPHRLTALSLLFLVAACCLIIATREIA